MTPPDSRIQSIPPRVLFADACRTDEVSKIKHAIELASLPRSRSTVQNVLSHAVRQAIIMNAENILSYVLAKGGSAPVSSNLPSERLPTQRILNILVAHGWDINARPRNSTKPFLWQAVASHDLTVWALDHGADVQPGGQESYTDNEFLRDHTDCLAVLEQAILYGCHPSTLDLVRSKGAPMGRRILCFAAAKAAVCIKSLVGQSVALVRHLLDKYNLDVNALDGPSGINMGNHCGTPLCYVAQQGPSSDCKDVIELLLKRGADPDLYVQFTGWSAAALAEQTKNLCFSGTIASWRTRKEDEERGR